MQPALRRLLLLWVLISAAAISAWVAFDRRPSGDWASAPPALQGYLWPGPRPVAAFELGDPQGRMFTAADLRGQWTLIYFGYLQCPDVCPTTLRSLQELRELMIGSGTAAVPPQLLFVSVDPANDNPERIGRYLAYFGDAVTGLTGDPAQLEQLARSLGVMYAEYLDPDGVRSIDHTTSIIVVDPQGNGVAALPGPAQPSLLLQQFQALTAHLRG